MPGSKVMVIGLDSVTLNLVRPWAAEGKLPNLARFLAEGAAGPLRSTVPMISPAAWATFATGTNPGKHGILDFCQFSADRYDARFVNASDRRGETFWEIAGAQGVRGGVINVPISYPPKAFNGFCISGMLSPGVSRAMANPPEVFDDLMAVSGDYAVDVDIVDTGREDVRLEFIERSLATTDARAKAAVGLYRKHRPQLFVVVFVTADRICHFFWRHLELLRAGKLQSEADHRLGTAIEQIYRKIDDAVGLLLAEAGADTDMLIMSDHGAGPLRKGLNLRKLLAREGLLVETSEGFLGRLSRWGIEAFARVAPTSVKAKVKARFGGLTRRAAGIVGCGGIDFDRTLAYPTGETAGVFVNLKGRQPKGIVEPGSQYEQLRDRIIKLLGELKDPETGQLVAEGAYRREEVWSGPCLQQLPDMVMVQPNVLYDTRMIPEVKSDEVFYPLPELGGKSGHLFRYGHHERDGILLGLGPHIKHTDVAGAGIVDVPATALALLGCKIPDSFDGRVLTEMLTDDVVLAGTIAGSGSGETGGKDVFSDTDQETIAQRLKGLGYI